MPVSTYLKLIYIYPKVYKWNFWYKANWNINE